MVALTVLQGSRFTVHNLSSPHAIDWLSAADGWRVGKGSGSGDDSSIV